MRRRIIGLALIGFPAALFADDVPPPSPADRLTTWSVETPEHGPSSATVECSPADTPVEMAAAQPTQGDGASQPDASDLRRWVADLGAEDWISRERAQAVLADIGRPALAAIRDGAESRDPETRVRCVRLLSELDRPARWTGALDDSWGHAGNWSPRGVPDSDTDVEVPPECPVYPAIRGMRAEAKNLTVDRGALLLIDNDAALRVGRDCVVFGSLRRDRGLFIVEHILAVTTPDSARTQVWVKGVKKYEFRRDGMFPPPSNITARAEVLVLPDEAEGDDPTTPIPPIDPSSTEQDDRTRW